MAFNTFISFLRAWVNIQLTKFSVHNNYDKIDIKETLIRIRIDFSVITVTDSFPFVEEVSQQNFNLCMSTRR